MFLCGTFSSCLIDEMKIYFMDSYFPLSELIFSFPAKKKQNKTKQQQKKTTEKIVWPKLSQRIGLRGNLLLFNSQEANEVVRASWTQFMFTCLFLYCLWKHQKAVVFRGYRNKHVAWNGLTLTLVHVFNGWSALLQESLALEFSQQKWLKYTPSPLVTSHSQSNPNPK